MQETTIHAVLVNLRKIWAVHEIRHLADGELLRRFIADREEAAFATLVQRHGPMVMGVCRRVLGDSHDAEDAFQGTFLVLVRRAGSIRRRKPLSHWLYAVARRGALKARAKTAARQSRERELTNMPRTEPIDEPTWQELRPILDEEIGKLPQKWRTPIVLCYFDGMSYDQAAQQLGCPKSSLASRLEGARELLRKRLIKRGITLSAGAVTTALSEKTAGAAVGAMLTIKTVQAAASVAAGKAVAAGVLSAGAIALMEEAMKGMVGISSKLVLMVLALGLAIGGAGWATQQAFVAGPGNASHNSKPEIGGPLSVAPIPPPKQAKPNDKQPPLDLHGDPLPPGAVMRLGTVAFRHGPHWQYATLVFTPDGKSLYSAAGGWIRRWNVATARADLNLGDGWRIAGSQGTNLITADGKVARFVHPNAGPGPFKGGWEATECEIETGKKRAYRVEFPKTGEAYSTPDFMSPDGKIFGEFTAKGALTLWNAVDGAWTHYLDSPGVKFTAFAFPPDSSKVVVGDTTHKFHVFEVANGTLKRTFGPPNGAANAVARITISPDGKWLATVGGDHLFGRPTPKDTFIRLWDFEKGTLVRIISNDMVADSLLFTADSRTLIATQRDSNRRELGAVYSWDVETGKPGQSLKDDPTIGRSAVAVSPDGKLLATMNANGVIRLWDFESGREKNPISANDFTLESNCFGADGKTLLTMGHDSILREWNIGSGRLLQSSKKPERGYSARLWDNGRLMETQVTKENQTVTRLYLTAIGKLLFEKPGYWLTLTSDYKLAAIGNEKDGMVHVFEVASGDLLRVIAPPKEEKLVARPMFLRPLGFTPDGKHLKLLGDSLSALEISTGLQIRHWNLGEQPWLPKPRNETRRAVYAVLSPDGEKAAFGFGVQGDFGNSARGYRIAVAETATGKVLHETEVAEEYDMLLAFSPDSKVLAAAGAWAIHLWQIGNGKATRQLEGHLGRIRALTFSADGKRLATCSDDTTAIVWDLSK